MNDLRIFLCSLEKLYNGRYVAWSELEEIKKQKMPSFLLGKNIKVLMFKAILKCDFEQFKILKQIDYFLNQREKINNIYIKTEQNNTYEIEGNKLDADQIAAVVVTEDAELILASAGSGKSASLLAKVNHIVNDLNIPADEVLVIAFTRKVVKELKERMKGSGVNICTFHSFGNKIIQEFSKEKNLKLVPDGFLEKIVEKALNSFERNNFLKEEDLKEFGDRESMQKLLISTLTLQKNEQISLKEFKERIFKMKDLKERDKALLFYKYYARIVMTYGKILRENGLYDFSDMLSWATRIIKKMPNGNLKYKYVLVDEVQDLSLSKTLLLKAILEKCQKAKLFAVGDDWQSIYRFAGSNLGVMKDFEKNFGLKTYRGVIRRTYRFGQPTAWVSEYFVRKNPFQSKKKVQTFKKGKTPIEICISSKNFDKKIPADYEAVNEKLQKLYLEFGDKLFDKNLQVISRYNRDIFRLVARDGKYKNAKILEEKEDGTILEWKIESAKKSVRVAFCSMHKSKGITRDIVFVINMNSGEKGMPSTRADEPILATMLAKADNFPLAEERRLFYVAITRAKEKTIIVSERGKISEFVKEIAKNLGGENQELVE